MLPTLCHPIHCCFPRLSSLFPLHVFTLFLCCRVDSREELSIWLCQQHNIVNERLDKPLFDCTIESLDKRWKDGVPGCWNYDIKDKLHESH
jgi:hypothetical protein